MKPFQTDLSIIPDLQQRLARVCSLLKAMEGMAFTEVQNSKEDSDAMDDLGNLAELARDTLPDSYETFDALRKLVDGIKSEAEAAMRQARAIHPDTLAKLFQAPHSAGQWIESIRFAGMELARYADEDPTWGAAWEVWQTAMTAHGWRLSWTTLHGGKAYLQLTPPAQPAPMVPPAREELKAAA